MDCSSVALLALCTPFVLAGGVVLYGYLARIEIGPNAWLFCPAGIIMFVIFLAYSVHNHEMIKRMHEKSIETERDLARMNYSIMKEQEKRK